MNTPSVPFANARRTNSRSTRPEHMTRINLASVVYCSLDTPAMSAAPYAHQWQAKPRILGLNASPALIRFYSLNSQTCRINLSDQLFIVKVLELYRAGRTFTIAQTIAFTEDRIDRHLFPLFCFAQFQIIKRARVDACV